MSTKMFLFLVSGLAILPFQSAFAQDEDFSKVELRVTKVAGNVYMLDAAKGDAGGNIGASVGEDGIVIVTTSLRHWRIKFARR